MWQPHNGEGPEGVNGVHPANGLPGENGAGKPLASHPLEVHSSGGLTTAGKTFPFVGVCSPIKASSCPNLALVWSITEAEQQLRVHGKNELEERQTSKLLIFLKLVRPLSPPRYVHLPGVGIAIAH